MNIKRALKYTRKKVGELFIFAGFILIVADIYLGWQDGVWNRYPLSMLAADAALIMGLMMRSILPLFEKYVDMGMGLEIFYFPHRPCRVAVPVG